jgi:hypothetical protein
MSDTFKKGDRVSVKYGCWPFGGAIGEVESSAAQGNEIEVAFDGEESTEYVCYLADELELVEHAPAAPERATQEEK